MSDIINSNLQLTNPPNQPTTRKINWKILAGVLLLAALSIGTLIYARQNPSQTASTPKEFYQTYKGLVNYKLEGQKSGAGAAFDRPVKAADSADLTAEKNTMEFVHSVNKNGMIYNLFYEAIAISQPITIDPTLIKGLDDSITNPADKSHDVVLKPIKDFISPRIPSGYTTTLGKAGKFSSPNITKDAWEIDFTAYNSRPKTELSPTKLTGKALLATGKNNFYYFMVSSVDYNWQPNLKTWQKILDGLKIDQ